MTSLNLDSTVGERLRAFVASDLFSVRSDVAKSEYWKHFSGLLRTEVSGQSVTVTGVSGFYVPPAASRAARIIRRALRAIVQPARVLRTLRDVVRGRLGVPRHMSYAASFDATMGSAEVSLPVRSPFYVDHRRLSRTDGVYPTAASVRARYRKWSAHDATPNIINHYYYHNILRGFIAGEDIRTVLEIGAGNGNFPSIVFQEWASVRVVLVDLPETLAVAIAYLSSLFPAARCVLPQEAREIGGLPPEFDFAFLTVDQLALLADNSVDLAINCHSFQEMTQRQIAIYLELVQRVCRGDGYFFTANRVEKIPTGADPFVVEQVDPPNRFAEYPWYPGNDVLVYEISRLSRLAQLDAVAMRLERIRK